MGSRALLIIDRAAPKALAAGQTHQGVKVIDTQTDLAVIEIDGARRTLRIGEVPVSVVGMGPNASGKRIVIPAGSGGHYLTQGQINGKAAQMLVDTGATVISIGVAEAVRLGLNYKNGQPVRMATANGVTEGWRLRLASVKVGDVTLHDVDAVVTQGVLPVVLLGNSFLSSFQMTQQNSQLILDRRY